MSLSINGNLNANFADPFKRKSDSGVECEKAAKKQRIKDIQQPCDINLSPLTENASRLTELRLDSLFRDHIMFSRLDGKIGADVHTSVIFDPDLLQTSHLVSLISLTENVHTMDFNWCSQINEAFVKALVHCKALKNLNLSYCENITDDAVGALEDLNSITDLNLEGCKGYGDQGLVRLAEKSGGITASLTTLNLGRSSQITDEGVIKIVQSARNLIELSLDLSQGITDLSVTAIADLKNLQILSLAGCNKITDVSFKTLKKKQFPSIKYLNISSTSITDDTVMYLMERENYIKSTLIALEVSHCQLTWRSFEYFHLFPNLERLSVERVNLDSATRRAFSYLEKCSKLTHLNVSRLAFAKDIIALVKKMPKLEHLYVHVIRDRFGFGTTQQKDFQELAESNPTLKIYF